MDVPLFRISCLINLLCWMCLLVERTKNEMPQMCLLLRYPGGRRDVPVYAGTIGIEMD
jgi:hypothetical protein